MITQAHSVTRLRQADGAVLMQTRPKILSQEVVGNLRTLNKVVRWLRDNGQTCLSINLYAYRPTIQVRPVAAGLLIVAAHGMNTNTLPHGERISSVVIDGCTVCWQAQGAA